jgi:carbon-monoxide dehydrogenase iron sulfur subunit
MATAKIIVFHPDKCKGCRECEKACSNVHHKNDRGGEWSAIRIVETDTGYEMTDCNMCGLCIDMCPVQALKRLNNGTVTLNKKTCVGCQACVGFCPRGVMRKAPDNIIPFKCIACGMCVKACPENALELKEFGLGELGEEVYSRHGRVCL